MLDGSLSEMLVVAALLLIALPGVVGTGILYPQRPLWWKWITGTTLGFAAAVHLSWLASCLSIKAVAPIWLLLLLVLLLWARRSNPRLLAVPGKLAWVLIIALGLAGAIRIVTTIGREVPMGWDPAFHSILTQKLLLTGKLIADWQPFENIALTYPLGSHTLMAALSLTTGQPPHVVFSALLAIVSVVLSAEVYAFARATTCRAWLAVCSATCFGLLAVSGSLDYARWGGLPNVLGMVFLIAFVRVLVGPPIRFRITVLGFLVSGIILVHHHVMLTACVLLGSIMVFALITRRFDVARRVLLGGALGSLIASPVLISYLRKASGFTSTAVMHFEEPISIWEWLPSLGIAFLTLMLMGIAWLIWQSLRTRAHCARPYWTMPLTVTVLLVLYLITGVIYPAIQASNGNPKLGLFTPSRFLTDLVPFLAVISGSGAYVISRLLRLSPVLVSALLMCLSMTLVPIFLTMDDNDCSAGSVDAFLWIRQNASANTIVLTQDTWAPYFTWRKTLSTPVPISEPQSFHQEAELLRRYVNAVIEGKLSPSDLTLLTVFHPADTPNPAHIIYRNPAGHGVEQIYPR